MAAPSAGFRRLARLLCTYTTSACIAAVLGGGMVTSGLHAEPSISKIVGRGASTCARFTTEIRSTPRAEDDFFNWAQGYMSAILLSRPQGVDERLDLNPPVFSILSQLEFLRSYCAEHPEADYSDAVQALYKRLRQENRKPPTP